MVEKLTVIYQLTILTAEKKYNKALEYIQHTNPLLLKMHTLVHYEKHGNFFFILH